VTDGSRLDAFLSLSSTLTAYEVFRLRGTGQAEAYFDTVTDVVGEPVVDELLRAWARAQEAAPEGGPALASAIRRELLSDPKLGPIARNVIKLWFVGIWYELPHAWRDAYGAQPKDVTFTVSAAAYIEALLWPSVGANPAGAKAPGYGSWVGPPVIPSIPETGGVA
jgi:hypothetical protein